MIADGICQRPWEPLFVDWKDLLLGGRRHRLNYLILTKKVKGRKHKSSGTKQKDLKTPWKGTLMQKLGNDEVKA